MSARLDPDGIARFQAELEKCRTAVLRAIAEDARRLAPVETGQLRESIEAHPAEGIVTVGTDHWQFQEYGTRYQDAQPFMRPALYRQRDIS